MFSKVFLAMTAREMEEFLPERFAYMACHFSSYSSGLSNLPVQIPENSILLLDDSMPVQGHDPVLVTHQLQELIEQFSVKAVLLDFQQAIDPETQNMASYIINGISCPAAVTAPYAEHLDCSVFLPPTPVNISLQDHLRPWQNRDVYLEIAPEQLLLTVTETGTKAEAQPFGEGTNCPHLEAKLHCHYGTCVCSDKVVFTLQRTAEDLDALTEEAYRLGVKAVVGLYQELLL